MAYATLDEVQQRIPQFQLTATTKPSTATAAVFLSDTESQFDSAMSNLHYTVPITGTRALSQAREIVCQGTIAKILYARGAALGTDAAFQSADRAQKQYDDALKALADPKDPRVLDDAPRVTTGAGKSATTELSGLLLDTDGEEIEPRITMTTKF